MSGGHGKMLNVLQTHASAPAPHQRPASPTGFIDRARALFWHVTSVALTHSQKKRDEDYLKSLEPAGGMPSNVGLHMRASTVGRVPHGG